MDKLIEANTITRHPSAYLQEMLLITDHNCISEERVQHKCLQTLYI